MSIHSPIEELTLNVTKNVKWANIMTSETVFHLRQVRKHVDLASSM